MTKPDFDKIAKNLANQTDLTIPLTNRMVEVTIKRELCRAWNSRGTADRKLIDDEVRRIYREANLTGREDLEINVDKILKELDFPGVY